MYGIAQMSILGEHVYNMYVCIYVFSVLNTDSYMQYQHVTYISPSTTTTTTTTVALSGGISYSHSRRYYVS